MNKNFKKGFEKAAIAGPMFRSFSLGSKLTTKSFTDLFKKNTKNFLVEGAEATDKIDKSRRAAQLAKEGVGNAVKKG